MRCSPLLLTILLVSIQVSGAPAGPLQPNELIIGGGSSESEGLSVSGMNLWLRRGEPGVAFGVARAPLSSRQFRYVLLIKGDPLRRTLAGHNITSSSDGHSATGGGHVEINGTRATIAHRLKQGPTGKQDWQETMTINGQPFDLKKGRVFLLDLSVSRKQPTLQQVQAELTKALTDPKSTEDVERQAKDYLEHLRKESAQVRAFLK